VTSRQGAVLAFLALLLVLEMGLARDVFASVHLRAEADYHQCVVRNYGMVPVRYYEKHHLYPKCLCTTTSPNRNSVSTTTCLFIQARRHGKSSTPPTITCPSGRITEMRKKGVPIISIGQRKYDGARAFEMYAIDVPKPAPQPPVTEQAKQLALSMTA
jgi:hypothetical protein